MHKQSELIVYRLVKSGELTIDEQGRIWRVAKRTADRWNGGTKVTSCKRVRAEQETPEGYLQVRAMIDGRRHYAAAARLVWLHFNGPIPQGLTVNHKRGNKRDNRPESLELATYSEQRLHAVKVLGAKAWDRQGSKHPKTTLTEAQVIAMRQARKAGAMVSALAAQYGISANAASQICRGVTWKHCLLG